MNAYCNQVANEYGIPMRGDNFIQALSLSKEILTAFSVELAESFTPNVIMTLLIYSLRENLKDVIHKFNNDFFRNQSSFAFNEATNILSAAEKIISEWNQRHSPMLTLDLYTLITINDENQVTCSIYNDAFLQSNIARAFRASYLSDTTQQRSMIIDNAMLFYDNGIYWAQTMDGELRDLTPEFFSTLTPPSINSLETETYYTIGTELFYAFPRAKNTLINLLFPKERLALEPHKGANAISLLAIENHLDILDELLKANLLTQDALSAIVPSGPYMGHNTITILVDIEAFSLLEKLLQYNLLTQEQLSLNCLNFNLYQRLNAILVLTLHNQYNLLKQLLKAKLLTTTQLSAIPLNGINTVMQLTLSRRYSFLEKLLDANLLTSESLAALMPKGDLKGFNVIMILILEKQLTLLCKFLNAKLLTKEHLLENTKDGKYKGVNSIILLALNEAFTLLGQLLKADLVTDLLLERLSKSNVIHSQGLIKIRQTANPGLSTVFLNDMMLGIKREREEFEQSKNNSSFFVSPRPPMPGNSEDNTQVSRNTNS